MKIAFKDLYRQLVLRVKMIRYKLLYRVRFIEPSCLSKEGTCLETLVEHETINVPKEFDRLSKKHYPNAKINFGQEAAYNCTFDRDISIHDARFVRVGENRYLNVDSQTIEPWSALAKPLDKKPTEIRNILLMPWGGGAAGYGDFIIMLLPKLARLLDTIPMNKRSEIAICLPHFHCHAWALDYLALLGISKNQILDGSCTVIVPAGGTLVLGSGPKPGHAILHPHDIRSMIRQLTPCLLSPPKTTWRRLYVSRKTGRKMISEALLLDGLAERGFETVYLEELSLHQQIELFQEAAVIVGSHGAGHANIIWAYPGTRLLEVFHPSWMHPCYAFISEILGMRYHCLVGKNGDSRGIWSGISRYGIFENAEINPKVFFNKIDSILAE